MPLAQQTLPEIGQATVDEVLGALHVPTEDTTRLRDRMPLQVQHDRETSIPCRRRQARSYRRPQLAVRGVALGIALRSAARTVEPLLRLPSAPRSTLPGAASGAESRRRAHCARPCGDRTIVRGRFPSAALSRATTLARAACAMSCAWSASHGWTLPPDGSRHCGGQRDPTRIGRRRYVVGREDERGMRIAWHARFGHGDS